MSDGLFLLSGVRTPIGSFRGSLSAVSPVKLGAIVAKEAIERSGVPYSEIEETFFGSVLTANQGQNVARQVALAAGLSKDSQAVTINKVCSSSMKALQLAALSIKCGYRSIVLVGGCENMSQVPFYVPRGDIPYGGLKMIDGIAKDGLEDAMLLNPMGFCAEKSAKDFSITREQSDAFATESYKKAASAWQGGLFADEVIPVSIPQRRGGDLVISEDEEYKKLIESKVSSLNPVFVKDGSGTITAANASTLNDGAVAAILVSGKCVPKEVKPLCQIVDFAESGGEPVDFTVAPIGAVIKLLANNNLTIDDISLWEVNEAFSVTVLAFIKELNIDPVRVNVKGGAVALGHPLGMSGLRIVVTLAHSLETGQMGVACICNGGGEAMAVLIKKH